MNTREALDWTAVVSVLGIGIIIIFISILAFQGNLSPEGYVVGSGTFLLAMATFYLAFNERDEGKKNREQDIELAEKDRMRLRLKEKLEGLYSPLIGIGEKDFLTKRYHRYEEPTVRAEGRHYETEHYVHKKMAEIRSKYKYLATDELKEALDYYYTKGNDEWEKISPADALAMLEDLWGKITKDFDSLSREYSD